MEEEKRRIELFYYKRTGDNSSHTLSSEGESLIGAVIDSLYRINYGNVVLKITNLEIPALPQSVENLLDREIICLKDEDSEKNYSLAPKFLSQLSEDERVNLLKMFSSLFLISASDKSEDIERSSLEVVFRRKNKSQKYFANVLTVFGDQYTVFENYGKIALNRDFKNRKSWLYSVEVEKK